MLATNTRGTIAEYKVTLSLLDQGWDVYQPVVPDYVDLVAVKKNKIRKIQVKSRWTSTTKSSCEFRVHKYQDTDIDYFACYINKTDEIAYIKANNQRAIYVAYQPAFNNQLKDRVFAHEKRMLK
jgi:P2-related tail formation protein